MSIVFPCGLKCQAADNRRSLTGRDGVREVFVRDAIKSGLENAQGIMLSLPSKQDVMVYLKQLMQNSQVHIPYDRELIHQLNVEQYEMMKTGQIRFDHPTGTHDDKLWAFALAVYASRPEVPEYHPAVVLGKSWRLRVGPRKGSWEEKFKTRQEWQ